MRDVMHDLETLGNSAGCAILSIGAVTFDPETGEMGEEFYRVINVNSCVVAGLTFDQDTLEWWGKQSPEARVVLKEAYGKTSLALPAALHDFSRYLNRACGGKAPMLWGNGADFDNPILATAYKRTGIALPWEFWNSRCYRTLKNLHPEVQLQKRTGTHHNALDDAKTHAVHALQIFAKRRSPTRLAELEEIMAVIKTTAEPDCDDCGGSGIFYGNVGPACHCTTGRAFAPPMSHLDTQDEALIG